MSVILTKGGSMSLTKQQPQLQRVIIACGWRARQGGGAEYDLDVSAAGLDASGKVPNQDDPSDKGHQDYFVYANHRTPSDRSMRFMGDNRTGGGEEESIFVDLTRVASNIERIVAAVVIWHGALRFQKFSHIQGAYIRILDADTRREIARFNLSDGPSKEILVVFGELHRNGAE